MVIHTSTPGIAGARLGQGAMRAILVGQSAVMSAVIAVLTLIAFPLPPPLTPVTLAPVAIFVTSTFLGPRVGFVSSLVGSEVGFTVAAASGIMIGTPLLPVFLLAIMLARGPEGYIIGILRKTNEILAMVAGTIFESLVFFATDYSPTYPILGLSRNLAYLDFGMMIDLIYVVPAVLVLHYLRSQLGVRYYDESALCSRS
jgi:uncharacterized membrane protein